MVRQQGIAREELWPGSKDCKAGSRPDSKALGGRLYGPAVRDCKGGSMGRQ